MAASKRKGSTKVYGEASEEPTPEPPKSAEPAESAPVAAAEEPVAEVEAPVEPPVKRGRGMMKKTASLAEEKMRIDIEKLSEPERRTARKEYDNGKAFRLYLPPQPPGVNLHVAQMQHNLATAQAQLQFLSATAALQQTPGQVLGELVRAGQYFLDCSGETCGYTMRQVVEGIQNQYYGNPEGLLEKTRQIVELLRVKVLAKLQQPADGNSSTCAKAAGKEESADEGTSAEVKGAEPAEPDVAKEKGKRGRPKEVVK